GPSLDFCSAGLTSPGLGSDGDVLGAFGPFAFGSGGFGSSESSSPNDGSDCFGGVFVSSVFGEGGLPSLAFRSDGFGSFEPRPGPSDAGSFGPTGSGAGAGKVGNGSTGF